MQTLLAYPERFYGAVLVSAMSEVSDWVLRSRIRLLFSYPDGGPH